MVVPPEIRAEDMADGRRICMSILDRYIVRQFLITFFFGLLTFLLIFVVIDMMEKLDDFIDASAPLQTVVQDLPSLHARDHQTDDARGDAPGSAVCRRPLVEPK